MASDPAQICGALTKQGAPCKCKVVGRSGRCAKHGGSKANNKIKPLTPPEEDQYWDFLPRGVGEGIDRRALDRRTLSVDHSVSFADMLAHKAAAPVFDRKACEVLAQEYAGYDEDGAPKDIEEQHIALAAAKLAQRASRQVIELAGLKARIKASRDKLSLLTDLLVPFLQEVGNMVDTTMSTHLARAGATRDQISDARRDLEARMRAAYMKAAQLVGVPEGLSDELDVQERIENG